MSLTKKFNTKLERAVRNIDSKQGRDRALAVIRPNMKGMVKNFPGMQEELRVIKKNALSQLDPLVTETIAQMQKNGCKVFLAEDRAAARKYVTELVNQGPVVKSKTNVGKEIGIVSALEDRGLKVVETDLGDWINQLAGSEASHPLAPAIHIRMEKIRQMFSEIVGRELKGDVNELVGIARKQLRAVLETASFGITGANAIAADTGAIILTENEGNIRAVTTLPRVHIVVAGINKIVPTLEDGFKVVQAAAVYGVGQDIGTYVSTVAGPAKGADRHFGPEEVHVILVDNGRTKAIEEGFGEAFYCINCGSCQNFCPVYDSIGNSFGSKYIGGIGIIQTAFTESLSKAEECGLSACLGCGTCLEVCPNKIDTPEMINRLRNRVLIDKGLPFSKRYFLQQLLPEQKRLENAAKFGAKMKGPMFKAVDDKGIKVRLGPTNIRKRLLPEFAKKSFLASVPEIAKVKNHKLKVAFYTGCLVNIAYTSIGFAAVKILSHKEVEVVTPKAQQCCGLPLLKNGDLAGTQNLAKKNIDIFNSLDVDAVINVCASCGSTIKNEYPEILKKDASYYKKALQLADKTVDITKFLVDGLKLTEDDFKSSEKVSTVTYHDPCHLRVAQGVSDEPRKLLSIAGMDYVEMQGAENCCGFGGTVSLDHYTLTQEISGAKAKSAVATGADVLCSACPGCIATLSDGIYQKGSSIPVKHLVELLAERL